MEINLKSVKLANGEKLGYRKKDGGEKLLVLLHGNMTSSKHWDILIESMPDEFTIYAPDLRGFGISSYNQEISSLHDFSEDLKMFCDKLNLNNFNLMGWSTGGGVAMDFAADNPEYVKKLILMESVGTKGYPIFKKDENGKPIPGELLSTKEEIANDPVQVLPVLNAYKNKDKDTMKMIWNNTIYTDNQPDPEKYNEYLEDMFTQRNLVDVDYALAHFNISNEHNGLEEGIGKAEKIEAPTLILYGENDKVVTEQMAKDINNDIGENANLQYLKKCGHSPLIDDLDQLLENILNFIN
ncbi:MAG TPA: alpha/beta hydrolase [Halanaerobiales bacterium]|nr:alpha/beta hydrolase [Halanaerobiales bacterium]